MVLNKVVNGIVVPLSSEEENAVRAEWAINSAAKLAVTVKQVQAEAERRIETGTKINGTRFKTDSDTMIRLRGLLDEFDSSLKKVGGVTYRTAAGAEFTFTNRVQIQALHSSAIKYISAVLETSATLQAMDPIPADFMDDRHWP